MTMRIRRNALPASAMLVIAVVALVFALSACGGDDGAPPDDASPDLPGTFVPSQGRGHFNYTFNPDRTPTPYCNGVATAEMDGASNVAVPTPAPNELNDCYSSNPPSSGWHLPSQRNVEVVPGVHINIPPEPDIYPPDIQIPREAIPHILEHAGVFVGYNCADGDSACADVVSELERVVNDRIENGNRVVMARDSDLPDATIGLTSWTRIETFPYAEFTQDRVVSFISTHSCRFDPEGFC